MKLFVWDFHGVLEKGNDYAFIEITNYVLEKNGFDRRMTLVDAEIMAGHRWHEYYAYLLPGVDQKKCFALQEESIENFKPEIVAKHIQLNDHAELVLESIQNSPFTQILISNTQPWILDEFVKSVGVEKYFPPLLRFGVDNPKDQSSSKKECLTDYLRQQDFPEGIVSIGDSPHDMALTKLHPKGVGYLYTHPGRSHREAECHFKINDLRDVLCELPSV